MQRWKLALFLIASTLPACSGPAPQINTVPNQSTSTNTIPDNTAPSNATNATNEFDDQLTWIGPPVLFNRLIASGQLP